MSHGLTIKKVEMSSSIWRSKVVMTDFVSTNIETTHAGVPKTVTVTNTVMPVTGAKRHWCLWYWFMVTDLIGSVLLGCLGCYFRPFGFHFLVFVLFLKKKNLQAFSEWYNRLVFYLRVGTGTDGTEIGHSLFRFISKWN